MAARRIGGIQEQIDDGRSGILLDNPSDLAAYGAAVTDLLSDRARADSMGMSAKDKVAGHFLGTHSLLAYFGLAAAALRGFCYRYATTSS